jgi:hypothetical protein
MKNSITGSCGFATEFQSVSVRHPATCLVFGSNPMPRRRSVNGSSLPAFDAYSPNRQTISLKAFSKRLP